MKLLRCQSGDELAQSVLTELRQLYKEVGRPLKIFMPTGQSPRDVYTAMTKEKDFWRGALEPLQIDEFISSKRLFFEELRKFFLAPLGLEPKGKYIDPQWSDFEMMGHVESVLSAGIDCALLGLGPNGHVGFHEPGVSSAFLGGRVTLTDNSKNRVKGAVTDQAYTFGVGTFLRAKQIILIIKGEGKEKIFSDFLNSPPNINLPVSLLKDHSRLSVITDLN